MDKKLANQPEIEDQSENDENEIELFDPGEEPTRKAFTRTYRTGTVYSNQEISNIDKDSGLVNPVWEIQPQIGETDYYYRAFLIFADLPPVERKYGDAYKKFTGKVASPSPAFLVAAKNNLWILRASALDVHRYQAQKETWVLKDDDRRRADYEIGELLRELSLKRLEQVNFADLSVNQALRFAELASMLQANSIPKDMLNGDNIKDLLTSLPDDRRKVVIGILIAKFNE